MNKSSDHNQNHPTLNVLNTEERDLNKEHEKDNTINKEHEKEHEEYKEHMHEIININSGIPDLQVNVNQNQNLFSEIKPVISDKYEQQDSDKKGNKENRTDTPEFNSERENSKSKLDKASNRKSNISSVNVKDEDKDKINDYVFTIRNQEQSNRSVNNSTGEKEKLSPKFYNKPSVNNSLKDLNSVNINNNIEIDKDKRKSLVKSKTRFSMMEDGNLEDDNLIDDVEAKQNNNSNIKFNNFNIVNNANNAKVPEENSKKNTLNKLKTKFSMLEDRNLEDDNLIEDDDSNNNSINSNNSNNSNKKKINKSKTIMGVKSKFSKLMDNMENMENTKNDSEKLNEDNIKPNIVEVEQDQEQEQANITNNISNLTNSPKIRANHSTFTIFRNAKENLLEFKTKKEIGGYQARALKKKNTVIDN